MVGFYYASYGLVIIGALISIITSWNMKRTYKNTVHMAIHVG